MGEYDVALKKMHQYDSIKKEIDDYQRLLSKLIIPENDIPSDYVTHSVDKQGLIQHHTSERKSDLKVHGEEYINIPVNISQFPTDVLITELWNV